MQQQRQDEPEGLTDQIIHCLAMYLPTDSRLGMHAAMDVHFVCVSVCVCVCVCKCHTQSAVTHNTLARRRV